MRLLNGKTSVCEKHIFPHLGQRIIKTAIAVYLCFLVCYLRTLFNQDISSEAAITAVVCMQPYVRDTKSYAVDRYIGTLIGSAWGMLLLLLLAVFPALGANRFLLYGLMAVGVLLSLYTSVLFRQPDTSSLSAIVFICIVIAFPNIEDPLFQAFNRFLDVMVGTTIAIGVNVFRFPRRKNPNQVFFVRIKDLMPDQFSQIDASVLYRMNHLIDDGARICLVSEHAPAFFVSQMSMAKVNTPLIVMDGAAVYDMNENRYQYAQMIPETAAVALCKRLNQLKVSYFIYTIRRHRTCIFHHGKMIDAERKMIDHMKRSPYRRYFEGEICDPKEIVYLKIVNTREQLNSILADLCSSDPAAFSAIRLEIRPHHEDPSCQALYLYSAQASMKNAMEFVMGSLQEENRDLSMKEVHLRVPYHSERDAHHLLHQVEKEYEPLKLPWRPGPR